ncbi:MAG: ATP-dependent Clp protease ATP-binding subunit, partial [Butyricicoccus pullicaecorum]|nr:ATP-dependent Clp protease ATP-binding subunit [Butyricicoccus pullicaecorum]
MQMPMCSRCGKNVAVIFITKMDPNHADNTTQEGLCLKCARTLGIKPLDQMMDQMGLNDEALEMLSSEINSLEDLNDLILAGPDMEDEDAGDMEDEGEEDSGNGES